MSNKRAFFVLGPESSGTRLMTRLLIAAGCFGDDGHVQRLDAAIPRLRDIGDAPGIVWRRSLPHDKQWPDIGQMLLRLDVAGYTPVVLVMSRDWHAIALSQVAAPHVPDVAKALYHIDMAYRSIWGMLINQMCRFELVNYESLTQRPQATVAQLMARLGLAALDAVTIYDGNAKYYAGIADFADQERAHVREAIKAKYGFEPPDEYVTDLLAFVDEITRRDYPRLDVAFDLDDYAREVNL